MAGRSAPGSTLWASTALIAALGSAESGWTKVAADPVLTIGRQTTAGTYAFEIDWSRDGVTVDFTETVVIAGGTTVVKHSGAVWARFRARNTDAALPFTAHATVVTGWQV